MSNWVLRDRCARLTERVAIRVACEPTLAPILAVTVLALVHMTAAVAQPCNPVIDGTYCATQMRSSDGSGRSSVNMRPIQSIGGDMFGSQGQPATLGAITFQGGGTQCIGLLRRGRCN
jgi:hypothetical protein